MKAYFRLENFGLPHVGPVFAKNIASRRIPSHARENCQAHTVCSAPFPDPLNIIAVLFLKMSSAIEEMSREKNRSAGLNIQYAYDIKANMQ